MLANGEKASASLDDNHAHNLIALAQLDAANAGGYPAHGSYVVLRKTDTFAVGSTQNDLIATTSQSDANNGVALIELNGMDTGLTRTRISAQGSLFDQAGTSGHDQHALVKLADR